MNCIGWIRAMVAPWVLLVAASCEQGEQPGPPGSSAGQLQVAPEILPPGTRTVLGTAGPEGVLLRWQDATGDHWRRVAPDGSWMDLAELSFPADIAGLASDGAGYLAAITPRQGGPAHDLYVVHLSALGEPSQPGTLVKSLDPRGYSWIAGAQIAYQHGAALVLWSE
jgi:hypothetical protein